MPTMPALQQHLKLKPPKVRKIPLQTQAEPLTGGFGEVACGDDGEASSPARPAHRRDPRASKWGLLLMSS